MEGVRALPAANKDAEQAKAPEEPKPPGPAPTGPGAHSARESRYVHQKSPVKEPRDTQKRPTDGCVPQRKGEGSEGLVCREPEEYGEAEGRE